jgi:hypothetical protein
MPSGHIDTTPNVVGGEAVAKCQEGDAAIDWVGFRATIIERRRDAASAGSVFWPYGIKAQVEPKGKCHLGHEASLRVD